MREVFPSGKVNEFGRFLSQIEKGTRSLYIKVKRRLQDMARTVKVKKTVRRLPACLWLWDVRRPVRLGKAVEYKVCAEGFLIKKL